MIDVFLSLLRPETPKIRLKQDILKTKGLCSSLFLSVQDSEPYVAIDRISTRYSSVFGLVSVVISFDYQIEVSLCIPPIARLILLLMSSVQVEFSAMTPLGK